jgi:hypothetical protein
MSLKLVNSILAMTALLGWLPPLLCLLLIHLALEHGADAWPDIVFDIVFISLYFAFLGAGAYIYTVWFKD